MFSEVPWEAQGEGRGPHLCPHKPLAKGSPAPEPTGMCLCLGHETGASTRGKGAARAPGTGLAARAQSCISAEVPTLSPAGQLGHPARDMTAAGATPREHPRRRTGRRTRRALPGRPQPRGPHGLLPPPPLPPHTRGCGVQSAEHRAAPAPRLQHGRPCPSTGPAWLSRHPAIPGTGGSPAWPVTQQVHSQAGFQRRDADKVKKRLTRCRKRFIYQRLTTSRRLRSTCPAC